MTTIWVTFPKQIRTQNCPEKSGTTYPIEFSIAVTILMLGLGESIYFPLEAVVPFQKEIFGKGNSSLLSFDNRSLIESKLFTTS